MFYCGEDPPAPCGGWWDDSRRRNLPSGGKPSACSHFDLSQTRIFLSPPREKKKGASVGRRPAARRRTRRSSCSGRYGSLCGGSGGLADGDLARLRILGGGARHAHLWQTRRMQWALPAGIACQLRVQPRSDWLNGRREAKRSKRRRHKAYPARPMVSPCRNSTACPRRTQGIGCHVRHAPCA